MIEYREWMERTKGGLVNFECEGWFLFGIIPLYVKKIRVRSFVEAIQTMFGTGMQEVQKPPNPQVEFREVPWQEGVSRGEDDG